MRLLQPLLARALRLPLSPFVHFQSLTNPVQPLKQEALQQEAEKQTLSFLQVTREGTSEQLRKQNAGKLTSHGSLTEKANCWYHSSKDHINTQPFELLLVHLMRPPGLPHAVPSAMADGLGNVSPSKHLPCCPKSELHPSSYHRLPWYETWSNRADDCA